MARARNIKPGFFLNDELAKNQPAGRLLFAGLWLLTDREGRLEDRPRKIKAEILPYDDCDVDKLLTGLHDTGFIVRYSTDNHDYIQVINFTKHQNPHPKEAASIIPPPPGHIDSGAIPYHVPPEQRKRIMERDGYKCVHCGADEGLSIDHIIPRTKGGSNKDDNLQVLCATCNSSKGNQVTESNVNKVASREKVLPSNVNKVANPADSLIPDPSSLILIPDSLIPHQDPPNPQRDDPQPAASEPDDNGDQKSEFTTEFETFWNIYPRPVEKRRAWRCWKARLKGEAKAEDIILAATHYADAVRGSDPNFIKHPATFLGPDRPYEEWIKGSPQPDPKARPQPKPNNREEKYKDLYIT